MHETRPFVLSIAGIDPSAGAGLLSDIKTLEQHRVSGLGVATCVTMQNHESISEVQWFDFYTIRKQIDTLFEVYSINCVKIGVVPNWSLLNQIIDHLLQYNNQLNIVLDPVLISSSGFRFCEVPDDALRNDVLSKVYLITPNQTEFNAIFGTDEKTECHVLLKSVSFGNTGTDTLIKKSGELLSFEAEHVGTEKHGSGCVLSSSIAANLAKGESLESSISLAKRYIENYLSNSETLIAQHS